jgi:hypothetical protein
MIHMGPIDVPQLFRARLWNIKRGEDKSILCGTAPAHVAGTSRARPDSCEDKVSSTCLLKIAADMSKGDLGNVRNMDHRRSEVLTALLMAKFKNNIRHTRSQIKLVD